MKLKATLFFLMLTSMLNAQTIDDGLKAIDNENYITARRIFLQYTATNSADAMGWYYLGNTYCFLEKNDSARIAYTQGTVANPKGAACEVGIGKTYLSENKFADAQKYFDQAKSFVNVNKDINIAIYLADANLYNANPVIDEAIRLLKQAENISNMDYRVYSLMGDAYTMQFKGGDAVTAYQRCTEINATKARPFARIGYIWNLARNYSQSKTAFEKALALDANFAPAYRDFAELYFNTAQYDKAKETFAKYLELADKTDETQYRYAQFLFLTKDYAKCLQIVNELKAKTPGNINLFRLAAYCAFETGDYTNGLIAIETFFEKADTKKIISMDYEYLGKLLLKAGNDSMAEINFGKAIGLDSTKTDLYGELAKVFYDKKNYTKAAYYYDLKIRHTKTPNIQDAFQLGRSYYFDSTYALADSAFKLVTKISATWPIGYQWRARSNLSLDNSDSLFGYAVPYYQLMIEKALIDTINLQTKAKKNYTKEFLEAYRYLGDFNTMKENYDSALFYYDKYLACTPIILGMTKEEVIAILGTPNSISKQTTVNGQTEMLFYKSGSIGFDVNGKVDYINTINEFDSDVKKTIESIKAAMKLPKQKTN